MTKKVQFYGHEVYIELKEFEIDGIRWSTINLPDSKKSAVKLKR